MENHVARGVEGVKPDTGGPGGQEGLPTHGVDESGPGPDIHNASEKVAPGKLEDEHGPFSGTGEGSPKISGGRTGQSPGKHLPGSPRALPEKKI